MLIVITIQLKLHRLWLILKNAVCFLFVCIYWWNAISIWLCLVWNWCDNRHFVYSLPCGNHVAQGQQFRLMELCALPWTFCFVSWSFVHQTASHIWLADILSATFINIELTSTCCSVFSLILTEITLCTTAKELGGFDLMFAAYIKSLLAGRGL